MVDRTDTTPKLVWSGTFRIFGVDVRCHVLDDGQRIIEADSVAELIEAMEAPDNRDIGDIDNFHKWQDGGS